MPEDVHVMVAGATYEDALTKAMQRIKVFLPDDPVGRERDEVVPGGWYVHNTDIVVSPGGTAIDGRYTFRRKKDTDSVYDL